MRKIILISILILTYCLNAQELKSVRNKRFQIGFQINPSLVNDLLYTGYFGGNIRFKFYETKKIDLDLGFNTNYFKSDILEFSDALILNPTAVINIKIENSGLKPYLSVGYAFFKSRFTPNHQFGPDPFIGNSAIINYNGFSISPGLRYHINKIFFIDLNYNLLEFKDDFEVKSSKSFNLLGIGAGFKL